MDLIIETDIGHDPDDFFAICYLIAAGVNIRALLITPGDPDQIAIARLLRSETGQDFPIGTSKLNRTKLSSGSIHHELLKRRMYPLNQSCNVLGADLLVDVFRNYPDSELFVIGPVSSLGAYLKKYPDTRIKRATMQGGFLPYKYLPPTNIQRQPQFEDKTWMPTFNLNGDREGGLAFLNANIEDRRMVGKNVCHSVLFNMEVLNEMERQQTCKNGAAMTLFEYAAYMYFEKHTEKKFHDPTAACLHLHPDIGVWFRGKTTKMEGGWTTQPDPSGDHICADIDIGRLWQTLLSFR